MLTKLSHNARHYMWLVKCYNAGKFKVDKDRIDFVNACWKKVKESEQTIILDLMEIRGNRYSKNYKRWRCSIEPTNETLYVAS